jgi:hypothetical protein
MTLEEKYQKLLEFVKKDARYHIKDPEINSYAHIGISLVETILWARQILKEIGENEK